MQKPTTQEKRDVLAFPLLLCDLFQVGGDGLRGDHRQNSLVKEEKHPIGLHFHQLVDGKS
jgi:hypothetical protein